MSQPTLSIPEGGGTVLLAIEDDVSADLLGHRMRREGMQPEHAQHGGEALWHLKRTPFDLVVIDARLPGLTGLELLRATPSDDIAGEPKIVLLGQRGNDEQIVQAFELGAVEYVQRPFAPEVALARITRFLTDDRRVASQAPSAASLLAAPAPLAEGLPFEMMVGGTAVLLCLAMLFAVIAVAVHACTKHFGCRTQGSVVRWREALLAVLAGDSSPQHLLDEVDRGEEHAFLRFLVPYAVMVRGSSRAVLTRLATPCLIRVEDDLRSWRPGWRAHILQLFGLLGDDSCRGPLRRHLDDPAPLVRYTAFRWLARRGVSGDAERLLSRLDQFARVEVNQLASALVGLGEGAGPALRAYLGDDTQSAFTRVVCAETLRWMGDGEAASLATQILAYEPDPELAAALLRLLRRVGRPEHAPLVRSYCSGEEPFVCIHAARALGQIGHPDHDRKLLCTLVTDTEARWVAFNAAKSLTELGQTTPLRHLSRSEHGRASLAKNVINEPQR